MTNTMTYLKRLCDALNRRHAVKAILKEIGVPFKAIKSPEGGRNYVVHFGRPWVNCFGAHHDRVREGVPAANDNGASVAILLGLIRDLHARAFPGDLTVVLLDYEEGLAYARMDLVGSKYVGNYLVRRHINPKFFCILELCGIGNVLLWRNGCEDGSKLDGKLKELIDFACESGTIVCQLPDCIPSDDAVLRWGGLEACLITMLPEAEVEHHYPTWGMMHTVWDNFESIQPETVGTVQKILDGFIMEKMRKN